MKMKSFKVLPDKKENLLGGFVFLILGSKIICGGLKNSILAVCLTVFFIGFSIYLIFKALFYCVSVTDTCINVRTSLGRRHSFTCSEIKKIDFSHNGSSSSVCYYSLDIFANNRRTRMISKAIGFKQMVSYLLEQRDARNIKESAFSSKVAREMKIYILEENMIPSKEEMQLYNEIALKSPVLSSFQNDEQLHELLKRVGCLGEKNCCFYTHGGGAETKGLVSTFERCDGYLINKTERGLAMIPLRLRNRKSKPIPSNLGVIEQEYYFVPNEDIKKVQIPKPISKRDAKKIHRIYIEYDRRRAYIFAYKDVPSLSYHNRNLTEFVNTYNI